MHYHNHIEQIKSVVSNAYNSVCESKDYCNTNYTETIKIALGDLGEDFGYKVCTSTKDKIFNGEWLYDLVWYKENEEGFLLEVPLVVESEWDKNLKALKFDFEKLLLAKSPLKLMICQANETDEERYVEYFQKAVNVCPFTTKEETYIIAVLQLHNGDADGFNFYTIQKNTEYIFTKPETLNQTI